MENHEERAIKREAKISKIFEVFSNRWTAAQREQVYINRNLLLTAVEQYFHDIDRKKRDHHIKHADCHKRAAFTVKWLLRFRPIQFQSPHPPRELVLANEEFAFVVACAFLDIKFDQVPRSLIEHSLYHFRNDNYDPESWACTFFLMEVCGQADLFPAITDFLTKRS